MNKIFREWLDEIEAESDPEVWAISPDQTKISPRRIADLVAFVSSAFEIRGRRCRTGEVLTSYLWHDIQAGQLRFATDTCSPDKLPFDAKVRLVEEPEIIIAAWLRDDGFIKWGDLEESDFESPEPDVPYELNVWAVQHEGK